MTWYDVEFVFRLLEEGVPEEEILGLIRQRAEVPDSGDEDVEELLEDLELDPAARRQLRDEAYVTFLGRLAENMKVYRKNLLEDAEIRENIDGPHGVYSGMRSRGRALLPKVDRLIMMIAGVSSN